MSGEYYNWHDLGDRIGAVSINPYTGGNVNKKINVTGNIVLTVNGDNSQPIQFRVKLTDDSGLGLFTLSVTGSVLGVPLPALIAAAGEMLIFDWDGDDLWRING